MPKIAMIFPYFRTKSLTNDDMAGIPIHPLFGFSIFEFM